MDPNGFVSWLQRITLSIRRSFDGAYRN
jgi:hypothetical protein